MKITYRIPTKEQYAFVEFVVEDVPTVKETFQEAKENYDEMIATFTKEVGPGLPPREWSTWLDGYLQGKPGSVEEWSRMDESQKKIINEIKKAHKRIKSN